MGQQAWQPRTQFETDACAHPIDMRSPSIPSVPRYMNHTQINDNGHIFACLLADVKLLEMIDVRSKVTLNGNPTWPQLSPGLFF